MKRILITLITLLVLSVIIYAQPTTAPAQDSLKDDSTIEKKITVAVEDSSVDKEISAKEDTPKEKSEDTAATTVSENTGILTIITEPDSAFVIFDEALKGKSPITIRDIPSGKHTIVLKKKGHFAKKATVIVKAGSENELKFDLIKPIKLSVSSKPSGASVLLNGKKVGKTPFSNSKLKPGPYTVQLAMEGYEKKEYKTLIMSGESDSLHSDLNPIPKVSEDTTTVVEEKVDKEEKADEKEKSKLSSILDKVALGVFVCFSLIILLIELTQK